MKKLIDVDEKTLSRLKLISLMENISVKSLIESVVQNFASEKVKNNEDELLLKLMQQAKSDENATENEFFSALKG